MSRLGVVDTHARAHQQLVCRLGIEQLEAAGLEQRVAGEAGVERERAANLAWPREQHRAQLAGAARANLVDTDDRLTGTHQHGGAATHRVGDQVELGPWTISFDRLEPIAGSNWTALEAQLTAHRGGKPAGVLEPQARSFWAPQQETSEAALLTVWNGQVYAVVGEEAEGDRWQLRLWWKPFVTFIWYGGILIALGGALALVGRLVGDRRRREGDGQTQEAEQA